MTIVFVPPSHGILSAALSKPILHLNQRSYFVDFHRQHIKLIHKAPIYCAKCKDVFETSEALESHLDVPEDEDSRACKHRDLPKPAGVTPAMEEKLKGRWKASTPQALWGKIYEILFPNEAVPPPGKPTSM